MSVITPVQTPEDLVDAMLSWEGIDLGLYFRDLIDEPNMIGAGVYYEDEDDGEEATAVIPLPFTELGHALAEEIVGLVQANPDNAYGEVVVSHMVELLDSGVNPTVPARLKRSLTRLGVDLRRFAILVAEERGAAGVNLAQYFPGSIDRDSDVAIARIAADALQQDGQTVYTDGTFWRWNGRTHWERLSEKQLRLALHALDGTPVGTGDKRRPLSLTKGKIDGVLHELAVILDEDGFFDVVGERNREDGIPPAMACESGVITFGSDDELVLMPHGPQWRTHYLVNGYWEPGLGLEDSILPPKGTLLRKLVTGPFRDLSAEEMEKNVSILQEAAGCAMFCMSTRLRKPKALLLYGKFANNGKSELLALLRGLVPGSAVTSVSFTDFNDEKHRVRLAGSVLNVCDEMPSSGVAASELFKQIITGSVPVSGRGLYKDGIDFYPRAFHIGAGNILPVFTGGVDQGVKRRLLILPCNRVVPPSEQVENIALRILREEADLLLAWALGGARRLWKNKNFSTSDEVEGNMEEWLQDVDPAHGWSTNGIKITGNKSDWVWAQDAYIHFTAWAKSQLSGAQLPSQRSLTERVVAIGNGQIAKVRGAEGMKLSGIKLLALPGEPDQALVRAASRRMEALNLRVVG